MGPVGNKGLYRDYVGIIFLHSRVRTSKNCAVAQEAFRCFLGEPKDEDLPCKAPPSPPPKGAIVLPSTPPAQVIGSTCTALAG